MKKYFIAFGFEEKIEKAILEQKNIIRNLVGEQKYLSDNPHSTIVVLTLDNLQILDELEKISKELKRISVDISGFHIFYNDIQTSGHTLTCSFSQDSSEKLKEFQLRIINRVNKYNTRQFFKPETIARMSEIEKENTINYGFPFVGNNWIPHLTLASIDKDKFKEVFSQLKNKEVKGKFLITSLNFYEIDNGNKLIKKFELK